MIDERRRFDCGVAAKTGGFGPGRANPFPLMTILIVDDVPQMAELMRVTLVRAGLVASDERVRLVHSVVDARRELLRHRPDLILLDEVLPGESVVDFLAEGGLEGVEIVLVSATVNRSSASSQAELAPILARIPKWGWSEVDSMSEVLRGLLQKAAPGGTDPKKSG